MFRQKNKTVKKSVGASGMFGKIMSRFKTKPKQTVSKKITKSQRQIQKKIATKTKNGHDRKANSKTTIDQVRKIFIIKTENPNLSQDNIGSIVDMSGVLVRYYVKMGKTRAIGSFKQKELKIKIKAKKKAKKVKKKSNIIFEGTTTIVGIKEVKLTKEKAGDNLNTLFKKEKYPTEHQSDPRYFSGSEPPQSVATSEAFDEQKRKNNALRAISAKKFAKDKADEFVSKQEQVVLDRLRERHQNPKTKPKIHYTNCPCCNPHSTTPLAEYQAEVRRESLRRHDYAQKQMRLKEREKELDDIFQSQQPTVAERTQQGTKLCRKCDGTIPYSQASRSFSIYREYYCEDHEPKLN